MIHSVHRRLRLDADPSPGVIAKSVPISATPSAIGGSLVQATDVFTKTRRERIPAGPVAASLLLTVFVNTSVACTVSDRRRNVCSGQN